MRRREFIAGGAEQWRGRARRAHGRAGKRAD